MNAMNDVALGVGDNAYKEFQQFSKIKMPVCTNIRYPGTVLGIIYGLDIVAHNHQLLWRLTVFITSQLYIISKASSV